ncbi:MAG: PIN domain-containing protein [Victivallales bacterium]
MKESLNDYVHRLKKIKNIHIIPVDEMIFIEDISLKWEHKDPSDRTIVATAKLKNLPIITKDPLIRNFYPNTIW